MRYATYEYDASGRAIVTTHAADAERYTLDYVTPYEQTIVTDPLGTERTLDFTTIEGVVKLTGQSQPAGAGCEASTSALTYDPNGNVSSRTSFDGTTTTYAYDLTRNLETRRIEAAGTADARTITTDWHPDWHLRTRLAEPKMITTWVYNGQPDPVNGGTAACAPTDAEVIEGMPIAVVCAKVEQPTLDTTGADGFTASADGAPRVWTYTYNRYGKVLTADGPRSDVSDVWTYEYYAADTTCPGDDEGTGMDKGCRGELMRATDPVGLVTDYLKYNAHGQVLQMRAPNGVTTTYTYDLRQRLTSQQVGSLLTSFDYDPRGLLERVTPPDGAAIEYTYDDAHRLTDITRVATGERIHYTLDNAGNHTAETVYDGQGAVARQLERRFDALGRLWKEIRSINGQSAETVFLHDEEDRLTQATDPLAHATRWQYNRLGHLSAEINALDETTALTPDANGATTTVEAANGATTQYTVDGFGQITQEVSPDRGTTGYTYDAAGNLLTRTDARGATEALDYDAAGRLTLRRYLDAAGVEQQRITTVWDSAPNGEGQIASVDGPDATLSWTYDSLGRMTTQTQALDGIDLTLAYAHDGNGRLQSLTYPSGRVLTFGYDNAGRVDTLAFSPYQIASTIEYQPFGGVGQLTLLNGLVHHRGQEVNGLPQGYTLGGQPLTFGFDLAGRITALDHTGTAYDQSFGYDAADRLTDYAGHPGSRTYTYDANGNRSSQLLGSTLTDLLYAIDSNRLTQVGTQVRSYDNAGNLLSDALRTLAYGTDGTLRSATTGAGTVSYRYDGFRRRVAKTGPATVVPNGAVRFIYDTASHLIGEYRSDGTPLREYVWLGDLPVAAIDFNTDGTTTAYAIETDHLGTPRLLTDATQLPRWRWTSPPFGEVMPDENPSGLGAVTFNLRFPGQYYDKESGLSYNWHRVYDAETGRYLQSDPIGLNGGWNTYGYVSGNPLSFTDPNGLNPVAGAEAGFMGGTAVCGPICGGVGAVIGAGIGAWGANEVYNIYSESQEGSSSSATNSKTEQCIPDCDATEPRAAAMISAYAWAGIPVGGEGASPIPWRNFNMPAGMSRGGREYGEFMRKHYPPNYGYSTPGGASVVEHPFGHPDQPGPSHHACPHFHAKNAAGVEMIFTYKPGS